MSLGARPTPHAASPAAAIFSPAHTHSHRPPRLRTGRAPRGAGRPGAPGACCACAADRWACAAGAGLVACEPVPLCAAGRWAVHWGLRAPTALLKGEWAGDGDGNAKAPSWSGLLTCWEASWVLGGTRDRPEPEVGPGLEPQGRGLPSERRRFPEEPPC